MLHYIRITTHVSGNMVHTTNKLELNQPSWSMSETKKQTANQNCKEVNTIKPHTENKPRTDTRTHSICYKSFCLPLRSLESPSFFFLSLARELSEARVWPQGRVSCKTWCNLLFLSSELKVVDDSTLDRLTAESANEDGTVTERLLCRSELHWLALELWEALLSSGVDAVDTVVNLQHETPLMEMSENMKMHTAIILRTWLFTQYNY